MSSDHHDFVGPLGFAGMAGGALFVVIYMVLTAFGTATYGTEYTFQVLSAVPVVLWVAGILGIYLHHRESFGLLGRLGTAIALLGFLVSITNSAGMLVTGEHVVPEAGQVGYLVAETVGVFIIGVAVALARELPHALEGGLLFSLSLPASVGFYYLFFQMLETFSSPLLGVLVFTGPFGAAWLLLGYELFDASRTRSVAGTATA